MEDEVWDANEDILVCQNGTLEISSGTLREHRADDYVLGAVPYEFDPPPKRQYSTRFLRPPCSRRHPSCRSSLATA